MQDGKFFFFFFSPQISHTDTEMSTWSLKVLLHETFNFLELSITRWQKIEKKNGLKTLLTLMVLEDTEEK